MEQESQGRGSQTSNVPPPIQGRARTPTVCVLQLYVEKARVDETAFGWLKGGLLDVGDIVGAKGTLKRTDKGEIGFEHLSEGLLFPQLVYSIGERGSVARSSCP
jgi:hypothetical protein